MKQPADLFTAALAACVAGYVALLLDYVGDAALGLSDGQMRRGALLAASILAALLAIDAFGRKPGKAK
jgi:hypothetical protein